MAAPNQINDTIDTGGTAQTALPADNTRDQLMVQAFDEDMWVAWNGSPAAAFSNGFRVLKNQTCEFPLTQYPSIKNAISIVSATTGARYYIGDEVN